MLKKYCFSCIAISFIAVCILSYCNKPTSPASNTLTVTSSPPAAGTLALSPTGGTYTAGTVVTVTAVPVAGFNFVNWTGDATGTTASISVTMDAAKTVVANFELASYTLTVTSSPPSAGTVTLSPVGGTYAGGTVVTVTAAPSTGYYFVNWTGNATDSSASVSMTMDAPKTIVANFAVKPGFVYQVKSTPLAGFESTVDAVTKASNVLDTLLVRIDSLPPSDSLMELDVYWGDSTAPKVVTGGRFPVGPDYVVLTHWYTRNADTINGFCSTMATATTYGGITRDTTIRIKVLKASQH